ncbi:LAFA_0F13542g1_1 [Lachancea sp. 'fantastica']|nr:LAFA_0F13542g1_1 [Lachancea sp. 'fantastica']
MLSMIRFRAVGCQSAFRSAVLAGHFGPARSLSTVVNSSEPNTTEKDDSKNPISQQEIQDLSSALEEPEFSIFPSIHDVKPEELVGHAPFGVKSYFVERSATGNLPVYTDVKRDGKIVTEIRRIRGDPVQLRNDLQGFLKHIPKNKFRVMMESRKVIIQGDVVKRVKQVLSTTF